MAVTADALADLRFELRFAAERFRSYAEKSDLPDNAGLFRTLASERNDDAERLDRIANATGLGEGRPTIDSFGAGIALGMGAGEPVSAASAAFRVQRAQNTLGRMAAQLRLLTSRGDLRAALGRVRDRISERREAVREARRQAQALEGQAGLAKDAVPATPESLSGCRRNARPDVSECALSRTVAASREMIPNPLF